MSAGGGVSSSSTKTRDIPKWAVPFFQQSIPVGNEALSQFEAAGGPGGGPVRDAATSTLLNEITGQYLDPSNNQALQKIEGDVQQQAQTQFASDVNQIEGNANRAGALFSSGVPAAEAQAAKELATNVGSETANLENQNYQQQAGYRNQAIQTGGAWNQQTLNDFLQMLNALRGVSSSTGTSGYSANITI